MSVVRVFFFFNDTATTEIYTLSLHDALPICEDLAVPQQTLGVRRIRTVDGRVMERVRIENYNLFRVTVRLSFSDRKSTRLNSSHANISYAVFCLKKNKKTNQKT